MNIHIIMSTTAVFLALVADADGTMNKLLMRCFALTQSHQLRVVGTRSRSTLSSHCSLGAALFFNRYNTVISKYSNTSKREMTRVGEFWEAKMDGVWRPNVNDVERISFGKPAKKKGTGSRGVPHRLNLDERFLFDQARRKGYLEVDGSGWRSQRRDAPLLNTYRSLCDARGQAMIVLHKGSTGVDDLVVDISPLRNPKLFHQISQVCLEQQEGGKILYGGSGWGENDSDQGKQRLTLSIVNQQEPSLWETRPIYQLPPYYISWQLQRSDAKSLGNRLAKLFDTVEENVSPSRKPIGVKPGKGRRHGGYGIG
jgi:hypothetical protein